MTNNATNFRKIYARQGLHNGLVILLPIVSRDVQSQLFHAAVKHLSKAGG